MPLLALSPEKSPKGEGVFVNAIRIRYEIMYHRTGKIIEIDVRTLDSQLQDKVCN